MKAVNLIPQRAAARDHPSGKGSGGAYVVLGVLGVLLADGRGVRDDAPTR